MLVKLQVIEYFLQGIGHGFIVLMRPSRTLQTEPNA
jgi:hypothetical protein